jgi:hypothetical protein
MVTPKTNVITASGDLVNITGVFFIASGLVVGISGQPVEISGQPVALVSGTIVTAQSGLNVVVQSGLGVTGSFTANVSGQPVSLTSGTIVIGQSGLNVIVQSGLGITPPKSLAIRIRAPQMLSDVSGGVTLVSGLVTKALIRSLDGDVYIGGVSGVDMPYSGFGMLLQRDDVLSLPIDNFNLLNGYAIISGYRISYGGVQ